MIRRLLRFAECADGAFAVVAATIAALHLCAQDPDFWFAALLWWMPAGFALYVAFHGHRTATIRIWSSLYLLLLSTGTFISTRADILRNFTAMHQGGTEFAEKFNRLDLTSRRMIAWHMVLAASSTFFWIGYFVFWRQLVAHDHEQRNSLSRPTCVLGLAVFWGMASVLLLGSLAAILASQ